MSHKIEARVGNDPYTEFNLVEWEIATEVAAYVVDPIGGPMVGENAEGQDIGVAGEAQVYLGLTATLEREGVTDADPAEWAAGYAQAVAEPAEAPIDSWRLSYAGEMPVSFSAEEVDRALEVKREWKHSLNPVEDGSTTFDELFIFERVAEMFGTNEDTVRDAWMRFESLLEAAAITGEGITFA